jgi:hypothetical protein
MDLAIVVFFLLAGVLEYSIASFSKFLDLRQANMSIIQSDDFNIKFVKMYRSHVVLLFMTALLVMGLLYLVITQPWGYEAKFGEVLNELSIRVCAIGSIGYFFLTWGMLNALYQFTLDSPKSGLNAIVIACAINFLLGFVLSRTVGYEYSVVGMLMGSLVFWLLTLKSGIKFFKRMDFHYYAAY